MTEQRQNHILRILMIAIITVMILVTCAYVAFAEEANIESQTSTEANRISTQSLPDTDELLEEYLYHTAGEQLGNNEATIILPTQRVILALVGSDSYNDIRSETLK